MNSQQPHPSDPRLSPFVAELPRHCGSLVAKGPVGRTLLPRDFVLENRRRTILAATLAAVDTHGYPATTVAHIASEARVSRGTIYESFGGKEDCVLAAYDEIIEWLAARIVAAVAGVEDWSQAIKTAVLALMAPLAADPRLARFCALEVLRFCSERREATIERLAAALRAVRGHCAWGAELPPSLEETLIGGVIWLIGNCARLDESAQLGDLVSDITFLLLTPYLDIPGAQRVATGIV